MATKQEKIDLMLTLAGELGFTVAVQIPKRCAVCGVDMPSTRRIKIYCSGTCKRRAKYVRSAGII